jgi:hypothetical protein
MTPKCDFCDQPREENPPVACHFTKPFTLESSFVGLPGFGDADGVWAACQTCHDFVVAGNRKELLKRAFDTPILKTLGSHHPYLAPALAIHDITGIQEGFWRGYEGKWKHV